MSAGPLPGTSVDPSASDPRVAYPARHRVVIVSLDGCREDAIAAAGAGALIDFGRRGARATRALTIPLSLTLPSHSSMLSGYDRERHGVDWNVPLPENGYIKVPTIFSVARAAGQRTVMVTGKGKFFTLMQPGTLDEIHELDGDDDAIAEQAVFVATKGNFDLMFVHFPNPDLTGHASGWMSQPYLERLAHVDRLFASLLAALPPDATVLVTADHGGQDFGHGSDTDIDRHIPWMIAGPGIKVGVEVDRPILTTDTAATVLHILGLKLSDDAQGRVVDEVFVDR